jgi:hypothetical protein
MLDDASALNETIRDADRVTQKHNAKKISTFFKTIKMIAYWKKIP